MNFGNFNLYEFIMHIAALIICITIHEFAHAYTAYKSGDNTPKAMGRISLNPIDHLDPMGTIMMVVSSLAGFGIGWGKPVIVNPRNFNHPRWDNLKVSLWGPLSNILTALVLGIILRFTINSLVDSIAIFLNSIVMISLMLAFFNLIPLGPLDGCHILSALLPTETAYKFDRFMAQHGMMVFILLIVFGSSILPIVVGLPAGILYHLFTGFRF